MKSNDGHCDKRWTAPKMDIFRYTRLEAKWSQTHGFCLHKQNDIPGVKWRTRFLLEITNSWVINIKIKGINYQSATRHIHSNHFHFPFIFSCRYSFLPQISISIEKPVEKLIILCHPIADLSDKMIFCLKLRVLTEYIELIYYLCMFHFIHVVGVEKVIENESEGVSVFVFVCVCEMNISLLNKYVSVSSCVYQLVNGNLNRSLPFVAIHHHELCHCALAYTHLADSQPARSREVNACACKSTCPDQW